MAWTAALAGKSVVGEGWGGKESGGADQGKGRSRAGAGTAQPGRDRQKTEMQVACPGGEGAPPTAHSPGDMGSIYPRICARDARSSKSCARPPPHTH